MYGFEEFEEFREFEQILGSVDEEMFLLVAGIVGIVFLVIGIVALVGYIFRSIGLYTMAKNRGIKNPWLAWIPVGNYWIAGSIADQYRYVARGEIKNRRKILLALGIAGLVLSSLVGSMANGGIYLGVGKNLAHYAALGEIGAVLELIYSALEIAIFVFWQIAMYDLYTSCDPDKNVLFLVLGIIFGFLEPFFIFFNRNKERGMPPRRTVEAEPVYDTVYQTEPKPAEPRTYREPWDNA